MKKQDVEIVLERAMENFFGVFLRIISDNGPQFVAKDFNVFIRISGMTHVRTCPYYLQSNVKVERVQKTIKHETIRKKCPSSPEEAKKDL